MLLNCRVSPTRRERKWVVHSGLHRCDPSEVLQGTLRGFEKEKYHWFCKFPFSAPYQALKICLSVLPLVRIWGILVHPWLFACSWSWPPGTASPTRGALKKERGHMGGTFSSRRGTVSTTTAVSVENPGQLGIEIPAAEQFGGGEGKSNGMSGRMWLGLLSFLLQKSPCHFLLLTTSPVSNCTFIAALVAGRWVCYSFRNCVL